MFEYAGVGRKSNAPGGSSVQNANGVVTERGLRSQWQQKNEATFPRPTLFVTRDAAARFQVRRCLAVQIGPAGTAACAIAMLQDALHADGSVLSEKVKRVQI